jgi:hypothetical protein
MTPRQGPPGQQGGQMNIEQMQETAMNVAYNLSSIVTMPVEIWLRLWFGSTYFSALILPFSAAMMMLASAFSSIAGSVGQMIPFVHLRGPAGIFGIGDMTRLFFLATFVHGIRIWRLMIHPEREDVSFFEGPPLPFFRWLPKGNSFHFVRIIYEPVFVWMLSMVLANLFIIQFPLTVYLRVAAFFLALKQYVAWYRGWAYARGLMDMAHIGPILARLMQNNASQDDMARLHLASLPADLPPNIHKATVAHLARAYSVPPTEEETHA